MNPVIFKDDIRFNQFKSIKNDIETIECLYRTTNIPSYLKKASIFTGNFGVYIIMVQYSEQCLPQFKKFKDTFELIEK